MRCRVDGLGASKRTPWPSVYAKYNFPTNNGSHNSSRELPAVEGRIARERARLGGVEGPAFPGIEDRHVGIATASERTASTQVEDPSRP